jgi:8-amino-7-oxononanoate synthase
MYAEKDARNIVPIRRFDDAQEHKAFSKRLKEGEKFDYNPFFVCHDSVIRDVSVVNGKEVINFGSYNYLGMSGRKEVSDAAKKAIDLYGTSASGSRLLAGEKNLYVELEAEIAEWKHTEASLVFPAGNLTNTTFIGNFCNEHDAIFYDVLSHSSIDQGCKISCSYTKRFSHNNYMQLAKMLEKHRNEYEKVLIVVEGVYSMDGDIAPIDEFVKLKKEFGAFLMVDEAHSSGVLGAHGGGVDEYFHLQPDDIDIKMGTLSKALGSIGGYIAGNMNLINYLKYNLPGFVFTAGISPPSAAAALEAIRIIRRDNSAVLRLQENIRHFVTSALKRNFNIGLAKESAIIPVWVGNDEESFVLSKMMLARGVFVPPAVHPAVPRNEARLRYNIISEHKPEQIETALNILEECFQVVRASGKTFD